MTNERLRKVREAMGLSQRALAARAGVAASSVNWWETHNMRPRPASQKRIADALRITPAELWPNDGGSTEAEA